MPKVQMIRTYENSDGSEPLPPQMLATVTAVPPLVGEVDGGEAGHV